MSTLTSAPLTGYDRQPQGVVYTARQRGDGMWCVYTAGTTGATTVAAFGTETEARAYAESLQGGTDGKGADFKARAVKATVQDEDQGIVHLVVSVFGTQAKDADSDGDVVLKGAFARAIAAAKASGRFPKGVWAHKWDQPIAKTLDAWEADDGLHVQAQMAMHKQAGRDAFNDIKHGFIDEYSFGYRVTDADRKDGARFIKDLDWFEWSPVLVGADRRTRTVAVKDGADAGGEGAAEDKAMHEPALSAPLAARDAEWDSAAADKRLRAWAGAEDEPNARYASGFLVVRGDPKLFTSYHLGFADVKGGDLVIVPKGVFAVANVLEGGRGASIPAAEAAAVRPQVARLYQRMAKEFDDPALRAPWEQGSPEGGKMAAEGEGVSLPYAEQVQACVSRLERLDDEAKRARAAVDDLVTRGEAILELRQKEGRTLSRATRQRLGTIHAHARGIYAGLGQMTELIAALLGDSGQTERAEEGEGAGDVERIDPVTGAEVRKDAPLSAVPGPAAQEYSRFLAEMARGHGVSV